MANNKFNLQHLLDNGLSLEVDEEVILIFQSAFQSLSEATADEQARDVASQLQKLVSPEKPITQFGSTWEAFLSVARNIPYRDHEGQDFIIKVIRVLVATPPWGDLPGLAQVMRTNWSDPTLETVEGQDVEDEYSYSEWLNLNSFNARLFGAGLVEMESFVIWQMRQALEEDLNPNNAATDLRLSVASEWAIHSGPVLLRKCLVERRDITEGDKKSRGPGPLYTGHGGLNLERWGFWKRRFEELRPVVAGEEAVARVD
ncbi:uncharacterized protein F5Z01DRAFT_673018 [Emericellopsis atlantica]|uniref:Uncharacterized protein n=1 Tax=Emericellopsis atlantica TaxID=2614577 RepID=A0A9P8CQW9_9HYPO|nr:uncharacterized protein F5Z01DRAFT_673018 [Emericellopsis atlantica]KAG9255717.1 hypothetical protein F5Z01DRAFT_673018 [Emericellopsis atlantica]